MAEPDVVNMIEQDPATLPLEDFALDHLHGRPAEDADDFPGKAIQEYIESAGVEEVAAENGEMIAPLGVG